LRPDLVIVEQTYRGETSFVVKDREAQKYFRFRPLEVAVMQEFDGEKTFEEAARSLAEDGVPLSATALEKFARKLQNMGLLERSLAEKSVLQLERLRAERRRKLKPAAYRGSLLRMRWSVGDPDKWLERWLPWFRFMFTPPFIVVSIVLFLIYGTICVARWPELSAAIVALYTPSQYTVAMILTLYLTGIGIIVVHELGHAFSCKYFGGEVHEIGAMLIYFEPAFYCNVNDAWTFPQLSHRLWVTAAGSWIQLILGAIAAMIWWVAVPGTLVSQIALAAVLIGGITTILANANPLIPLDGYYALSDWLAIPNLRQRAFGYFGWAIKRHILRLEVPEPAAQAREKRVFLVYGVLSAFYILGIFFFLGGLVFGWVSKAFGFIGITAFVILIWSMARKAITNAGRAVMTSIREHRDVVRNPRFRRWGLGALAVLILIGIIPWPITARGVFTVASSPTVTLVAAAEGVVEQVYTREGILVPVGGPVLRMRNFELEREAAMYRRLADSLDLEVFRARARGRAGDTERLAAERDEARAEYSGVQGLVDALTLRAPTRAIVATARLEEYLGRYYESGDPVAHLLGADSVEARIPLSRAGASLIEVGQRVRLVSHADPGSPITETLTGVAAAAGAGAAGGAEGDHALEARVRLPGGSGVWRPGVTGEAKITLRRSTIAGALWWAVRSRIRGDLLL
jgi:putative peptide zinc metalloprotease protein